jgi:hypothetical protein
MDREGVINANFRPWVLSAHVSWINVNGGKMHAS